MTDTEKKTALKRIYQNNWDTYCNVIEQKEPFHWDYVVLTASNAEQGKWFESQLEERRRNGFLPENTIFGVVPDPIGERVGNGGAALGAFRFVSEHAKTSDFSGLKVLVILSSGDAKRVAQYSPIGKVFSPVPRVLPNGRSSALFDEIMMSVVGIPSQIEEGFLILSGDVLLLFDEKQFIVGRNQAAAIAFKEPAILGTGHGIFMDDEDGLIHDVWHKLPMETMKAYGAIDTDGCVNIDTGAVFFPPDIVSGLFRLICEPDGSCTWESFHRLVNGTIAPSLYVDFFYPLSQTATFEGYMKEVPEGKMCPELLEARKLLWKTLRPYRIKLLKMAPAKFIDFGTTKDVLDLMSQGIAEYSFLGWQKNVNGKGPANAAYFEAEVESSATVGKDSYLEYSGVSGSSKIGEKSILSFVSLKEKDVPSNVVLSGLRMKNGKYVVRIYGVNDNPKGTLEKNATLFGTSMKEFLEKANVSPNLLWKEGEERILWNARLYRLCDSMEEAVDSALELYGAFVSNSSREDYWDCERTSLSESFNLEDGQFLSEWVAACKI